MRSRDQVSLCYLFWLRERKTEASRANSVLVLSRISQSVVTSILASVVIFIPSGKSKVSLSDLFSLSALK